MNQPKINVPTFSAEPKLFEGIRFDVCRIERQFGDKSLKRDVIIHPGAVVVLPIIDEANIVLIKNRRCAVNDNLWELPAGTLEKGEEPEKTALRELIEETGYKAKNIEYLNAFFTSPGICNEIIYSYVCRNLTYVGQALEDGEEIAIEQMPFKKALQMIKNGDIKDAKTIVTLLYYKFFNE